MYKVGAWLLKGLLRLLGLLPLRVHYALGRFMAWLFGDVFRYRRDVVAHNLALCFPDKSGAERKALEKAFYRHLGEFVGIHEFTAVQQLREHPIRGSRFPGAVRTTYDV